MDQPIVVYHQNVCKVDFWNIIVPASSPKKHSGLVDGADPHCLTNGQFNQHLKNNGISTFNTCGEYCCHCITFMRASCKSYIITGLIIINDHIYSTACVGFYLTPKISCNSVGSLV